MAIDASPVFQTLLNELRETAADNAAALAGTGNQTVWFAPPGWAGDVFNIAALKTGFDRDVANKNYQDALLQGSMGPAMGAKVELDYLAVQERAFRLRHTTTARAMAHTSGRLAGHGDYAGVHTGIVIQSVVDLYKQGAAKT